MGNKKNKRLYRNWLSGAVEVQLNSLKTVAGGENGFYSAGISGI